jgi:hypothetical protein
VLHAHRREHVDAAAQELVDVVPALGMAGTRRVGVCQVVDEDHLRLAAQHRVEVELAGARGWHHLEARRRGLLLAAAVHVDEADHDVAAGVLHAPCGREHRVGLAGTGKGAEENLELSADIRCGHRAILAGLEWRSWTTPCSWHARSSA